MYKFPKEEVPSLMERNARISRLAESSRRERFIKKRVWGDGLSILDDETRKEPLIIRKALAIKKILGEMPVEIERDELIVGRVRVGSIGMGLSMPRYATEEELAEASRKNISPYSVWGHYVPDYQKLLSMGISGIQDIAREKTAALAGEHESTSIEKRNFYRAVSICCDGVIDIADRYAALAEQTASNEGDPKWKNELLTLSGICKRVPEKPAKSFREALQSFWFLHLTFHSTMNFIPVGRFDQYIFPYLTRDIDEGNLDLDAAQQLVDALWIKFNDRAQSKEHAESHLDKHAFLFGGVKHENSPDKPIEHAHWLQNITLAGVDSEGNDAANLLTYLCLNATEKLNMTNPGIIVRLSPRSSDELLSKSCKVLQKGLGMPTLFNDDVISKSLQKIGIPADRAADYCGDGCWEILVPGKTEMLFSMVCGLSSLERALNGGCSRITGKLEGARTGDPRAFTSFEDVLRALEAQLDYEIEQIVTTIDNSYGCLYTIAPVPLLSSLIDDCLESGKDITQGGARFLLHGVLITGISHLVDSLAAMRKFCFEEGTLEIAALLDALDDNFEGREDLRQMLVCRAPKFGNDNDDVDALAREVLDFFTERLRYHSNNRKNERLIFYAGAGTFEGYVAMGREIGATPDGRLSGAPLASNMSPSLGRAVSGHTAAVNSFTKLNLSDLGIGAPIDLCFEGRMTQGKEGLRFLKGFIKTFLEKGGNMMTVSINSIEKLRAAQKFPEQYRDLIVHVAGWQAYFVDLTAELQEIYIQRLCEE